MDPSQKHDVNHELFKVYLEKRAISHAGSIHPENVVICAHVIPL